MPSLLPLDIGCSRAKLADWFELSALLSPSKEASTSEIRSMFNDSFSEDRIEADPNQDEVDYNKISSDDWQANEDAIEDEISLLLTEISQRATDLGAEYPFSVNDAGDAITVKHQINFGGYVYLYCLIVSHSNREGVMDVEIRPTLNDKDRDIFQICATLAAAGEISGPAISFGWPRPDSSTVHDKLLKTHAHFPIQAVKIRQNLLPGTPPHIKDDGIDVIYWKQNSPRDVVIQYYLGQVATGLNWEDKSIIPEIEKFLNTWYDMRPHSVSGRMFVPFNPTSDFIRGNEQNHFFEIRRKNDRLGKIIDRQILPKYAEMALGLDTSKIHPVERLENRDIVETWVDKFIESVVRADA